MENNAPNQGLPLVFMYEGYIYSKEMDGCFHKFNPVEDRKLINSLGILSIDEARILFAKTTFISSIIVLTNNVNLKV